MAITGGCHCGAIRYHTEGEALTHVLCHCTDCRRHAGAPMVGWTMYPLDAVKVTSGMPKVYASSEHGRRHFCPDCGTGIFYTNADVLPGIIDVQSATYDDPDAVPARAHIQVPTELVGWSAHTNCPRLSAFRHRVSSARLGRDAGQSRRRSISLVAQIAEGPRPR